MDVLSQTPKPIAVSVASSQVCAISASLFWVYFSDLFFVDLVLFCRLTLKSLITMITVVSAGGL